MEEKSDKQPLKLNFGIERLLSDKIIVVEESLVVPVMNINSINLTKHEENCEFINGGLNLGLNYMDSAQRFPLALTNGLCGSPNQNFILRPSPIRFGIGRSPNGK